jgi:hypothetical protein
MMPKRKEKLATWTVVTKPNSNSSPQPVAPSANSSKIGLTTISL